MPPAGVDDALLETAQAVLDRDGFHGATLEAVAADSGFALPEVTAAFPDTGAMFLATVDRFLATQMGKYDDTVEATDFADAALQYGQKVARARLADGMPSWDRVLVEFWIVASRDEAIRDEVRRRNTDNLDRVGAVLEGFAARFDRDLVLAPREFARGIFALGRGMGLERTMDDTWSPDDLAVMVAAYVIGLTCPRHATETGPS